jgi:hypothetical protein
MQTAFAKDWLLLPYSSEKQLTAYHLVDQKGISSLMRCPDHNRKSEALSH